MRELRRLAPSARLTGIGGRQMADAGMRLIRDSSTWGGIGLVESLKRCHLYLVYLQLEELIRKDRPDLIVLIEYPGGNTTSCASAGTSWAARSGSPACARTCGR